MTGKGMVSESRDETGNSIIEIGPVIGILFLLFFFPLIDLLAIALTYNSGSTLNGMQLREAALTSAKTARDTNGPIKKTLVDTWRNTGIGAFSKVDPASIKTKVDYDKAAAGNDVLVTVVTDITAQPFMVIPFPVKVVGLNKEMPFRYSSQQLLENPRNYDLTDQDPADASKTVPAGLPNHE